MSGTSTVTIDAIAGREGREATVRGWLYRKRSKGRLQFLVVRDGTGYLQAILVKGEVSPGVWETAESLGQESSLRITGVVRKDDRAPGGFEMGASGIEVIQETHDYPIGPKEHGPDFLLDHRHLWLRSKRQHALLRIRSEVEHACREFFHGRGFTLVDSPILTPAACEGTSTLFETDYFGDRAYLSQSGQLYLEPACQAFGKVYCFGPTFRAEKSKTRRHLTEFWMIEPEVAFADLDDIMELAEDLVVHVVGRVLKARRPELEALERDIAPLEGIQKPFPRLSYDEAAALLVGRGTGFRPGDDFGAPDETALSEAYDRPIMVHRYPTDVKAFYMEPDPERPDRALCVDMIAPEGYGEIIGGSQRIHDLALLEKRIDEHELPREAFRWYLDARRYGAVPHSGFGMGIERVVGWIGGIHHLREAIPYPRTLNRLYP
ncbi:MAG: asparagine--tRNA ligase [Acidobacteriota bacterium]|jgi:asparaginyl-tRNA synthetase